jgi:hypothetical protein
MKKGSYGGNLNWPTHTKKSRQHSMSSKKKVLHSEEYAK